MECIKCVDGGQPEKTWKICNPVCPPGQWAENNGGKCLNCHPICVRCSGGAKLENCLSCIAGYDLVDGRCRKSEVKELTCGPGTYLDLSEICSCLEATKIYDEEMEKCSTMEEFKDDH
jgi:hypothetical protein